MERQKRGGKYGNRIIGKKQYMRNGKAKKMGKNMEIGK
jgi:hypothetical protein